MFILTKAAIPFSLTNWLISTLWTAGFFLGAGVVGSEKELSFADIFTFLGIGEERGGRETGGRDENDGVVDDGLATTMPGRGRSGLSGSESPLDVRLPLLTRRDRKVDFMGREFIRFCRLGLVAVELGKVDKLGELEVGFTDLDMGREVFDFKGKRDVDPNLDEDCEEKCGIILAFLLLAETSLPDSSFAPSPRLEGVRVLTKLGLVGGSLISQSVTDVSFLLSVCPLLVTSCDMSVTYPLSSSPLSGLFQKL